jgi:hypothetical protein
LAISSAGNLATAEAVVAELTIGGKAMGTVTGETDPANKRNILLENEITFGKCTTKSLKDIGPSRFDDAGELNTIYVEPRKECLDEKEVDNRNVSPYNPIKTKSAFLNYSVTVPDLADTNNDPSLSFGTGLHFMEATGYSDFTFDKTNNLRRGNTYLKKDIDNSLMQITAGDTYVSSDSPFLKSSQIGGVSLSRKYTINPMINPYNSLDQRLTLQTKSKVEIYRNGQLVSTQEYDPGIYNLRGLPVSGFSGDIKMRIVDAYNNEQIIVVPYTLTTQTLKKGYDDFSISVGAEKLDSTQYNGLKAGGFYKYGFSNDFTGQISASTESTSLQGIYTTGFGVISLEKELSHLDKNYQATYYYGKDSWGFTANYTNNGTNELKLQANTQLTTFGLPERAGTLTALFFANGDTKGGLVHTFNPFAQATFMTDLSYSQQNQASVQTNLFYAWSSSLNFNLGYGWSKEKESSVYVGISVPLETGYKGWGLNSRAYANKDDTMITNEITGKYYNIVKLNTIHNPKTNVTTNSASVSGSAACATGPNGGKTVCGIGEPLSPGQGYIVGSGFVEANNAKGKIVAMTPYLQQKVTAYGEINMAQETYSLREGQGLGMPKTAVRNAKGKLYAGTKPYAIKTYTYNNEEYLTGKNGEFEIEGVKGEKIVITIDNKDITVNIKSEDEIADVGTIDINQQTQA